MCERQSRNVSRSVCSAIYTHTEKCVRLTFSRQREPNFVLIPPPLFDDLLLERNDHQKLFQLETCVHKEKFRVSLCELSVHIACDDLLQSSSRIFFLCCLCTSRCMPFFPNRFFFIRKEKHRNKRNETLLRMINAQNAFLHHCEPSCCSLPPFTLSPVFDCFFFTCFVFFDVDVQFFYM